MSLTAEKVAEQWKVSREDQDAFALHSNQRAVADCLQPVPGNEITPMVHAHVPGGRYGAGDRVAVRERRGPRADTRSNRSPGLRPVFAARGSVTAGSSSQMSDGAGAVAAHERAR